MLTSRSAVLASAVNWPLPLLDRLTVTPLPRDTCAAARLAALLPELTLVPPMRRCTLLDQRVPSTPPATTVPVGASIMLVGPRGTRPVLSYVKVRLSAPMRTPLSTVSRLTPRSAWIGLPLPGSAQLKGGLAARGISR